MPRIFFLRGLPGSGKTTFAKNFQRDNPNTVRVNKDDLRVMLHSGMHSKGREKQVLQIRDFVVGLALKDGHDVIVDDTNLNPIHLERMKQIAEENKSVVVPVDMPATIDECIERDLKRLNSVGSKVIWEQYNRWLKKPIEPVEVQPLLKYCIICDIDGTLALFDNRDPYSRDFTQDRVNPAPAQILKTHEFLTKIILLSGRQEKDRDQTERWLLQNDITYSALYMRPTGDTRKDSIVKRELYEQHIKNKYNVRFVLDDRNQVVDMWRSLGLTCFQVAEGNF